ncbi:helix-turn-helix domain-containing protein [Senegalia massiliensis]|uniref:DNA-binding protein n=1 Tax=Senegalia massiliensis TaxID=1720316 RepID=A0A845QWC7_9CLOT|nr:helix-turn-helix domain-containing protein [Senegalia massiliensis]NBI07217.1 DNA-binding protein [Senegalia massiliensis]
MDKDIKEQDIEKKNKNEEKDIKDNKKDKKTSKYKRATLTAKQAADYIGISYWLILELVKRKRIPCIDLGGRKLFRKKSLDDWMTKEENKIMAIDTNDPSSVEKYLNAQENNRREVS